MNELKLRFKEFSGEWENQKLENVVDRVTRKNKNLESKLPLTISAERGLVDQITYFNKSIAGKDLSGYYLLKSGEFAYNKSYSNGYPWGAIKRLDNYEMGVLSTLYICFKATNIHGDFLKHYFETDKWYKGVSMMAAEGARNHGLLNIAVNDFFKIHLSFPEENEQRKIAAFFEKLNQKIQFQQQKIDLLQKQKKGYMHRIFEQEIPFKDENGGNHFEWRELAVSDILILHLREIPKPNESYIRLGLRSHAKGTFHEIIDNPETITMDKLFVVHEGDFIINITFAWEQALAILDKEDHGKLVSHRFPTYRFNEGHYSGFYKYYFTTKYFKYCLGNASPGGAGRNRVLNKKDFMNIIVKVPKYEEQIKIANFLSKFDEKIQLEEKKLEDLKKQKKGFMQQMFI